MMESIEEKVINYIKKYDDDSVWFQKYTNLSTREYWEGVGFNIRSFHLMRRSIVYQIDNHEFWRLEGLNISKNTEEKRLKDIWKVI